MNGHSCSAALAMAALALGASPVALAQSAGVAPSALPGADRVAHAQASTGLANAAMSFGYGYTESVFGTGASDSHHRAIGTLALSVQPLRSVALLFRYGGRYDKHVDVDGSGGSDDGWIIDSRLGGRLSHPISSSLALGIEALVWFPAGGELPSFDANGASFESRALATWSPGISTAISTNAGFRFDRSSQSVDDTSMLSASDRLALGVSDSDAVLLGIGASHRLGSVEILGEATWDVLVGSDSPAMSNSPLVVAAGARLSPVDSVQLQLTARARATGTGDVASAMSNYPVPPRLEALLTVSYSYAKPSTEPTPAVPADDEPSKIIGFVFDDTGEPIAGATVTLAVAGSPSQWSATTEATGRFVLEGYGLAAGAATLEVESPGHKRTSSEVVLVSGQITKTKVTLERTTKPGALRGVVQSFAGRPLAAAVHVEPGSHEVTADPTGAFEIELAPGEYSVTITVAGHIPQTRTVVIEANGVTIMNVDMQAQ